MRTDALKGIPNINQYITAFIIGVNTLTMYMAPYLVYRSSGSFQDQMDHDEELIDALSAANTTVGWIVRNIPRGITKFLMSCGLRVVFKWLKNLIPVQIVPEEVETAASAAVMGGLAFKHSFTGADAV